MTVVLVPSSPATAPDAVCDRRRARRLDRGAGGGPAARAATCVHPLAGGRGVHRRHRRHHLPPAGARRARRGQARTGRTRLLWRSPPCGRPRQRRRHASGARARGAGRGGDDRRRLGCAAPCRRPSWPSRRPRRWPSWPTSTVTRIGSLPSSLPAPSLPDLRSSTVSELLRCGARRRGAGGVGEPAVRQGGRRHGRSASPRPGPRAVRPGSCQHGRAACSAACPRPARSHAPRSTSGPAPGRACRAIVHAGVLLVVVFVGGVLVARIPLAALAGVLMVTAVRMVDVPTCGACCGPPGPTPWCCWRQRERPSPSISSSR